MAEMRRYRVGLVGLNIGRKHLEALAQLPERYEIAALCGLEQDRLEALGTRYGVSFLTASYEAMLARADLDIIDICTPPHLHLGMAEAALTAGKDVVCEKPLVTSLAEADRLEACVAASGRRLLPVFQYRFAPGIERLKRLIGQGLTGRLQVVSGETHWNRKAAYYAPPWRGTWAGERGGCLLGHAIHIHDLLTWLAGPIVRLNAMTATRVNPIETEDCAALALAFEGGALGTSSVTLGAADEISRLRFCFEHLTAENDGREPYAPGRGPWRFAARDADRQPAIDASVAEPVAPRESYARMLELFHEHLEGRLPSSPVDLRDARASLELVTAAYHAARSGGTMALPPRRDHPLYGSWLPRMPALAS
jgi:predicted dehydrogenase